MDDSPKPMSKTKQDNQEHILRQLLAKRVVQADTMFFIAGERIGTIELIVGNQKGNGRTTLKYVLDVADVERFKQMADGALALAQNEFLDGGSSPL